MGPEAIQKKFEEELELYKKSQKEMSKNTMLRSELDTQLNENNTVKEELELLDCECRVFKLIGPALVRQDLEDAKQNVSKRITYITDEMKRLDGNVEALEKTQNSRKETLSKLQTQLQQAMAKAGSKAK